MHTDHELAGKNDRAITLDLPLYQGLQLALIEDRDAARQAGSPPVGALVFYQDAIRRYHCDEAGRVHRLDEIDADDLAVALAARGFSTGYLEPGTVLVRREHQTTIKAVYLPPARRRLALLDGEHLARYEIPIPALLWIVSWGPRGVADRLYALRTGGRRAASPFSDQTPLYTPGLFNVGLASGAICWGNVAVPGPHQSAVDGSPSNVAVPRRAEAFFASTFKAQYRRRRSLRHPEDLAALWQELDVRRPARYPEGDLVPAGTLGAALSDDRRATVQEWL